MEIHTYLSGPGWDALNPQVQQVVTDAIAEFKRAHGGTKMETIAKTLTRFEVKSLDLDARTFTGLSSTWDEDLGGDIIHRGAFKVTLKEWKESGAIIPLIDQHNYGSIRSVVGKMTDAKETDAGLESTFQVIEGPDGDEVLRRIKGQYVDGLSIGYEPVKWEYEEDKESRWGQVRHLKELKLHEVSVVIWPMNPGATITAAKAALDSLDPAKLDDDAKREIRAIASKCGAYLRPDTAPADKAADPSAKEPQEEPETPPEESAAESKASEEPAEPTYAYSEALLHRLAHLKLTHTTTRGRT